MQENFKITAVSRDDTGKGASRRLRRTGMVPGIIYGGNQEPRNIATRHNELIRHLENESFYSHILTVDVDGTPEKVVLKALQHHPAKPFVLHLDLQRVAATDRIKMQVPLHFVGEEVAPGVKGGGTMFHTLNSVEVTCAAKDLPEYIEVDVSNMELDDVIHMSQLTPPEGVELTALSHGDASHDDTVVSCHGRKAVSDVESEEAEGAEE
jgi:large subunit ribosomal protein L25